MKSWDEPQYSIHNLGIEESYGFGVLNEGQAIARREERQGPPERDVDASTSDHLRRSGQRQLPAAFGSGRCRCLRRQQRQLRPRDCQLRQLITQ